MWSDSTGFRFSWICVVLLKIILKIVLPTYRNRIFKSPDFNLLKRTVIRYRQRNSKDKKYIFQIGTFLYFILEARNKSRCYGNGRIFAILNFCRNCWRYFGINEFGSLKVPTDVSGFLYNFTTIKREFFADIPILFYSPSSCKSGKLHWTTYPEKVSIQLDLCLMN